MKKAAIALLLCSTLASCATHNKDEEFQNSLKKVWREKFVEDFYDTKSLNVFVVTSRKAKYGVFGCSNEQFGIDSDKSLKFGSCKVSVPKNHEVGIIDPAKNGQHSLHDYFKVLETATLQETDLIDSLKNSGRTPLVFVHGFNVKYQEAVFRAAQIAYDLKYQGPIVLFTWPAGAKEGFFEEAMVNRTYENNLTNAKGSIATFKSFLLDLQKNDVKINLMVHSMGHQVVLPALKELGELKPKTPLVRELILNAPDFDVKEFSNLNKQIKLISSRITLYCSNNDKALLASKTINKSERLGTCAALENIDTVNVSLVDDPSIGLGHGYYSSRAILSDVFQITLGIDADKRLFIRKSEPNSAEKYFLRL